MLETEILKNLEKLPDSLKQQVFHYTEFLVSRYSEKMLEDTPPSRRGGFGIWKGKIKIADDFDAPLEDFKDWAPRKIH